MRRKLRRTVAALGGLLLAGTGLTTVNAAPATAAPEECPTGYWCGWTDENRTGPTYRTDTDVPDLGSLSRKLVAATNNSSLFVCGYENRNYDWGNGYRTYLPGISSSSAYGAPSSLKFVRTRPECIGDPYPTWWSDPSPEDLGFGDLNGDRMADMLTRDTAGRLWFSPGDGTGQLIGAGGWNGISTITRHGDLNGDGHEDLVAREAATGKLWLYPGTGTGHLTPRQVLGASGWKAMNALVGIGDTNGDGHPDLYAREAATGRLWLYPGTGTTRLAPRQLVGAGGWNAMRNLVAVGDSSGDGLPDLATVTNEQYVIDGYPGHPGWLLSYQGLGDGRLAAGQRVNGNWYGFNGFF